MDVECPECGFFGEIAPRARRASRITCPSCGCIFNPDLPVCDDWPTCTADDLPCQDCRAHARQRADNIGEPLLGLI